MTRRGANAYLRGDDETAANAYLDPLDQFVQRTLGFGDYVRYMDDFILLATDMARLERARLAIVDFLRVRLRLAIHDDKPLKSAARGVAFCGFIVRPAYLLPRRRVVAAWREPCLQASAPLAPLLVPVGRSMQLGGLARIAGPCAAFRIHGGALHALRMAWTSGRGAPVHAACRQLQKRARRALPAVARFLDDRHGKCRLRLGDQAAESGTRAWPDWWTQRVWLRRQAPGAILLVQLGRLFELVDRRDARRLGIAWRVGGSAPLAQNWTRPAAGRSVGRPSRLGCNAPSGGVASGLRLRRSAIRMGRRFRHATWLLPCRVPTPPANFCSTGECHENE